MALMGSVLKGWGCQSDSHFVFPFPMRESVGPEDILVLCYTDLGRSDKGKVKLFLPLSMHVFSFLCSTKMLLPLTWTLQSHGGICVY